jgi:hypothetical protein
MLSRSKKILLILVLSTLVCISRAQEKSDPLHRLISITLDSTTIESFLEKLVEENDLYFSYNPDLLPLEIKKFSFSNRPLAEILQETLPDSLYKISLIDNQLIIHKKEPNPIKISGRIVEKDGKTPLEYAAVAVEGEYIGSMSNNDGYFDLKIPYGMRNKNLIFSSLGYKQKIVPIPQAESNPVVTLLSETIRLREIQVKPTDPLAILQQFRDKAEENYTDEPQLMVAFYRETARQDEEYVGVWEAVMEVLKAPYGVPADDRVRFLKGRKADLNRKPKEVYLKVQGGPLLINSLDIVKTQETFLNPEYQYLYKYRYEQPEMVNGRLHSNGSRRPNSPVSTGKFLLILKVMHWSGQNFPTTKRALKSPGKVLYGKNPSDLTPARKMWSILCGTGFRTVSGTSIPHTVT